MVKVTATGIINYGAEQICIDVEAPLYWWNEYEAIPELYSFYTTACSKPIYADIHEKEFTRDDFCLDGLLGENLVPDHAYQNPFYLIDDVIDCLNFYREEYSITGDERMKSQIIKMLPISYIQKRTVVLMSSTINGILNDKDNHDSNDWTQFIEGVQNLFKKR